MPCSVTLPAGTGKTELIAAVAATGQQQQQRALILTHTNAGVDVLRARLQRFGVDSHGARVETIASWSHQLVRHYPHLAQITVSAQPDWSESKVYYEAAHRVITTPILRRVLQASYAFAIIDEYQDCTIGQHNLITAIARELPVAVLGDPLQAVFSFDEPLPPWHTGVLQQFPAVDAEAYPWRWNGHNENLGHWLLQARTAFLNQQPLFIAEHAPVQIIMPGDDIHATRNRTCRDLRNQYPHDSIVVIGKWANDCRNIAAKLGGAYTIIETVEGRDMLTYARTVDRGTATDIARETAEFARSCASGVAAHIKKDDVQRLSSAKPITGLKRPGAEQAQQLLTTLLTDPSVPNVRAALIELGRLPAVRRYRHDAWSTVLRALSIADASAITVEAAVARLRSRARAAGRPALSHVVATTLLVKGLEFDHAVVLDPAAHEPASLYVALTRARKTLTIISASRSLTTAIALPKARTPAPASRTLWESLAEFV